MPPIRPGAGSTSADRAPYRVSLLEFVERFAVSPTRASILQGFLNYRAALHAAGIIVGFQWIGGSFVEEIETLEGRAPNDMDVVTFCAAPTDDYTHLFTPDITKEAFRIDAQLCRTDLPFTSDRVRWITYWYSLLAHRRSQLWKGFAEVDLNPFEDPACQASLNEQMQKEGWIL